MIRSMTAFARTHAPAKEGGWVIELRSVNHRYFDFSLKMPPSLASLETRVRELVQTSISRGKIMLAVYQEADERKSRDVVLDDAAIKAYLQAAGRLRDEYGCPGDLQVTELLKLPGVLTTERIEEDPDKSWTSLKKAIRQVLELSLEAKQNEGGKIGADIQARLKKMTTVTRKVERLAEKRPQRVFKRIAERVDNLLSNTSMDKDRLYREAALIAERSDITEEIVRLRSHLELFETRLKEDSQVGRELDFLCQEMHREVNTLGAKAQLFEISREVVFLKGELEKIREQVQNVE